MKLSNTQNVLKPLLLFIYLTFIVQTVQAELTSFAAIGDFGQDNAANTNVANMVDGWQPEFVITLGDNRYLNNSFDTVVGSRYCNYLTDVNGGALCPNGSSSENAFFPSLGNNDYSDGGGVNEYLDYFSLPGNGIVSSNTSGNERYYDYIQGPIHFFVINSDVNEADGIDSTSIQAQWLQTQMAASTTPWQVVYLHHAPYSSGTGGTDTTLQWPFAAWAPML